jgi:hypothetical protein
VRRSRQTLDETEKGNKKQDIKERKGNRERND